MASTWQADVVVVGGGMAGIGAAIAAARSGAATVLVERAGWLGGIGISGATGLHTFYNVYLEAPGAPQLKLIGGIPQELIDRTVEAGGAVGHVEMERGGDFISRLTNVAPEVYAVVAARACRGAGVKLLLHTTCTGILGTEGQIDGAAVWTKAGAGTVRGKVFVDCTGDGDLAAWAGSECVHYRPGDHGAYHAGFTFRLCNVDLHALEAHVEREGLLYQLAHAVKPGTTSAEPIRLAIDMKPFREKGVEGAPHYFISTSMRPRELTFCNCLGYGPMDALDPEMLTEAECAMRQAVLDTAGFLRRTFDGCADAYPAGPAPACGPRRGRAILCDHDLTQDDVTGAARFDDEIGLYGWIDNPTFSVRDAGFYGIPYRALRPRGLDNVLIAGRMMTVELVAHNSTRNTMISMVCGQAAGTAAALAAQRGCATRQVPLNELRDRLRGAGVLLDPQPGA
jgi:hypothetical protein